MHTFTVTAKVTSAGIMDSSDDDEDDDWRQALKDELQEYLELPQMKFKTDSGLNDWWREHAIDFPNLEVTARQYLSCPSWRQLRWSRADVLGCWHRVLCQAETQQIQNHPRHYIMFANANIPSVE